MLTEGACSVALGCSCLLVLSLPSAALSFLAKVQGSLQLLVHLLFKS